MRSGNLTERENFLEVLNGREPEWVPVSDDVVDFAMHGFLTEWMQPGKAVDPFGVTFMCEEDGTIVPYPGIVQLEDITQWKEIIYPYPDLDAMDWKEMAARDTAAWDRENHVSDLVICGSGAFCIFGSLSTAMGMENALISMIMEPEAWHEAMEYISDWYVKLIRYSADYYKPDIIEFSDDIATQRGLLMSPASYQEMLKPYYKKCYNAILEAGCHLAIHCCGKLDDIVDDLVEMGVEYMTPSQQINDLAGIKARYGNRLVMQGCWDSQGEPGQRGANEAVVRQAVRDCMDHYALGGGYVFSTCYTTIPEFVGEEHYSWIIDEARKYGGSFYSK